MKGLLIAIIVAAGGMAFAEETAHPAATQPAATTPTTASSAKKLDRKAAKNECLKENKNLKGPELKKCIHSKTM